MRRTEWVKKRGWQFDGVDGMLISALDIELCGVVSLNALVAVNSLLLATLMAPSLIRGDDVCFLVFGRHSSSPLSLQQQRTLITLD